jgi:hypothetical protein
VSVVATCPTAGTLVFAQTYHPNWRVLIDGVAADTFMVSPSALAVSLPPGTHTVVAEYRSTPIKTPLLFLGALTLVALLIARRRIAELDARLIGRWSTADSTP